MGSCIMALSAPLNTPYEHGELPLEYRKLHCDQGNQKCMMVYSDEYFGESKQVQYTVVLRVAPRLPFFRLPIASSMLSPASLHTHSMHPSLASYSHGVPASLITAAL